MPRKNGPEITERLLDIETLIYAFQQGKLDVEFPRNFIIREKLPHKVTADNFEMCFNKFIRFLDVRIGPASIAQKYNMTPKEVIACREKWATAISTYFL